MLRKPTEWYRATVDQQAKVIVSAEAGASGVRCVKLVFPESPTVHCQLDVAPEDIALSRSYEWPEMTPGRVFEFYLQPHQTICAVASTAVATLSVLIEYRTQEGSY